MGSLGNPETYDSYKDWKSNYDGCLMCACDHGCNQWVASQSRRTSLILRILTKKDSNTSLDKVVKMTDERVNWLWYYLNQELPQRRWRRNRKKK